MAEKDPWALWRAAPLKSHLTARHSGGESVRRQRACLASLRPGAGSLLPTPSQLLDSLVTTGLEKQKLTFHFQEPTSHHPGGLAAE